MDKDSVFLSSTSRNGFTTLGILTSHNGLFCVQKVTGLVHEVYNQVPLSKMRGHLSPYLPLYRLTLCCDSLAT